MYPEAVAMPTLDAMIGNASPEAAGLTPEHYLNTYGLAPADLDQTVAFAGHTGTVREMLDDSACPVGARVAETYREDGFEGVQKAFGGLAALGANVTISDKTIAYHAGEVSRDDLLGPKSGRGTTDFLD